MTPGRLVAPMSVRRDFQASPQWFANNPGAMDAVGEALLNQNAGVIQSWLQAQRQNARNADMLMWTANLVLPGITAQYWNYSGNEILRLLATPENVGGTVPGSFTISGDSVSVKPKFIGYPIPGAEGKQGDISGGCAWWESQTYFYEFASTPGWPTDEYADSPLMRNSEPFNIDKITFGDLLVLYEFGDFFTDFANSPVVQAGFTSDLWQHIGAGSKIYSAMPIKDGDMVYFEVRIDKLNTSVPATCHVGDGPTDPINFLENELIRWDSGSHVRFYPEQLNTWWTPAIGILPESMVAKDGNGKIQNSTPALLGMELDMTTPRSVYTVRTSYMTIHTRSQQFQLAGGFYGVPTDSVHGGTVFLFQDAPFLTPLIGTVQMYNPTFEKITQFGDPLFGRPENFTIVVHFDPSFLQVDLSTDIGGDILATGFTGDPETDALIHSMPLNATDGVYSPCLKGRADSRPTPLPSDDLPLGTDVDGDNGVFSGVELGEWQDGDIIRVAVDAKNGYVWFGRNKHWYYMKDRAAVQAEAGDDLPGKMVNWALVLDKDPETEKYPNYYAAVSWRVGGMEATILGGESQQFFPPAGFTRLASTPPLTLPLPGTAR